MNTVTPKRSGRSTCGPCHADANCIYSSGKRGAVAVRKNVRGYENPEVVLRIIEKTDCSQRAAKKLFEDMKQFLARSAVSKVQSAPSRRVDLAWHEFILFTKDYAKFCQDHFGRFIHHVPTPRLAGVATTQSQNDCSPSSNCSSEQTGGQGEDCKAEA